MLVQDYAPNDTITFDSIAIGDTVATLTATEWSSLSGIREGFRILTDDGDGEAVLLRDPQFQSLSVPVRIISPPSGLSFTGGNWSLRVPETKKVVDYVPRHIKNTLIIPEYLESFQEVSIDELNDAIIRLRNLRRWDVMDQEYLAPFLQTLGMFFQYEAFDTETVRRFIKELPFFLELSGTRFFSNYLSFVVGAVFTVTELWSSDYKTFIEESEIPAGQEDLYYPTNHVKLSVDSEQFGTFDPQTIIDLFYTLASVPLVLDSISQTFEAEPLVVSGTTSGVYEIYYTGLEV